MRGGYDDKYRMKFRVVSAVVMDSGMSEKRELEEVENGG